MTTTHVYPPLTPEDFETQYDEKHHYMFTDDEDCDMFYTYGHDRDEEFVSQLREYHIEILRWYDPDEVEFSEGDIRHLWAVTVEPAPEWRITWRDVTENTPGAFPVSVVVL
ncbi:Uncharacterised protein [Mycobacteroides abscessus subsp. abscessus]|uniref:hypothetical protein n=1 Tax=Mycobacteroides abscessus TaxID=36809 RepID=UPI0009A81E68|nr:hypothetical protein [Mycobacteroides abscessus]SKQ88719.1 Uncharacterised protein [Mycobacteroides abscessus subsp. abscessus]